MEEFSGKFQTAYDPPSLQFLSEKPSLKIKALYKGPESAIQFFWIENDPPPRPLELFGNFIRFGTVTVPKSALSQPKLKL